MNRNQLHLYPPFTVLQPLQQAHDAAYSRDIQNMSFWNQMTHYCLHQAKYVGRLTSFCPRNTTHSFDRIVTDSFVVTLAMANALRLDLTQELANIPPVSFSIKTPSGLADQLLQPQAQLASALLDCPQPKPGVFNWLARQMPANRRQQTVAMAQMKQATLAFARIHAGVAMGLSMDMQQMVRERLEARGRGNIFHSSRPDASHP